MFIAALIVIALLYKSPECPSIGEWLNKLLYIHTMILSNKKEQTGDTSNNLDGSQGCYDERKSQSQKNACCMIPFILLSTTDKITEMENKLMVVRVFRE